MALSSDNAAIVVVCRPSGILLEVVYDELGLQHRLQAHQDFRGIIAPSHTRKVKRFLRTIHATSVAVDWELLVAMAQGVVTMFFSGAITSDGIVIIGTKEPLTPAALSGTLAQHLKTPAIAPAMKRLRSRVEAKAGSEQKLKEQIGKLDEALARSAEKLEAGGADRQPGLTQIRLLEMAAHDLRNPISAVLAAAGYLIEDAGNRLEPPHINLLRSIESSCEDMLQLLQDMTEIPTTESRLELHLHSIDIGSLVESLVAAHSSRADSKRIAITTSIQEELPALPADQAKLSRALDGLISSAIRSSHEGGTIELQVSTRAGSVVVSIRYAAKYHSNHNLKTLLGPPYANRPKRRLADERAAMILAHLARIVEAHHGTVQFHETAGRESTITVTVALPISAKAKSQPSTSERKRDAGGKPPT